MSLLQSFCNHFYKNKTKTIFIVDILYMKDLNAFYGFKNGDFILLQLYKLLKSKIKNEILSYLKHKVCIDIKNIHVDVFTITLIEDLEKADIINIKNIIYKNIISSQFFLHNSDVSIDIDITIGCSKGKGQELLVFAERALHNAKMNYIHFMYYDSKLFKSHFINEELLTTLHRNILDKTVEPFFQPIQDNKTSKIVKYEALMRLYDKEGNILMPQTFIEKARKYRLFNKLMEILILKVIDYIKKYKIDVSINLDYNDILNPTMKNIIIDNIKNSKVGSYITVEILESKKISNYYLVNDFINDLKAFNVKIAIDDFGSGFSNYEHILNINTDYIKLDGSLIKKIDEDIYYNLLKSIVLFSKEQNIKIVAEFVSNLKILRYVKSLDIDYSQGYYIGKPQRIEKIMENKIER
ncbi:GGDEF domain-containing protein [Halarcobacter anaerophilus]|uniref:GGDEF domain-containing protein n=2 Tax=Halarcobacter anaerophilus TaxID=877500 RepID=A0A4Q0Y4S8_9BACT|nr:diguanylate phosphodiesterase [Halarcobacter anaerophilus]RXJ63291.1 GGDEF domain-containing protein [Halarcobacter anaerophilus]